MFKIYGTQQHNLIKYLQCYISSNKSIFTVKPTTTFVNSKLNIKYSVATIRKSMKSKMNISLKRVKARLAKINFLKYYNIISVRIKLQYINYFTYFTY